MSKCSAFTSSVIQRWSGACWRQPMPAPRGASGRVDSVRQAIMLLGISRVREITLATAIIDRFKAAPPFDARRLWLHSLGVAICAQEVARSAGMNVDVAYTAGLLHDLRQLLLFAVDPVA